jgi:rubredoxin-NAD+ reductase
MLSNAFAQGKQAAQLVTQSAAQMAGQLNATILTGTRVHHIDTAQRKVETGAGTFEYGTLALAVGAQPIRLTIEGNAANEIMSVNHIGDYEQFRARIAAQGGSVRVTILGAGLIGCEFADDLAAGGHRVTVVDPNPLPLSALAAPALSKGLQAALQARGVALELGTTAVLVERHDGALQVTLGNGKQVETDIVLSAVGLRPDLRLAQQAQVQTARGILVDRHGRTSAPGVYALGDCAEYTADDGAATRVLPYVAPLMAAARAIARTLAGEPTPIELKPAPVIVKTLSYPLALLPAPANRAGTWHEIEHGGRTVCRYYDDKDVMVGFGVAPQEAGVRQGLMAELGTVRAAA